MKASGTDVKEDMHDLIIFFCATCLLLIFFQQFLFNWLFGALLNSLVNLQWSSVKNRNPLIPVQYLCKGNCPYLCDVEVGVYILAGNQVK